MSDPFAEKFDARGEASVIALQASASGTTRKPAIEGDVALDETSVRAMFGGISKMGLRRWRCTQGFPQPSFYVGRRSYTWKSQVVAWIEARPKTSPQAGTSVSQQANAA